MNEDALTLAHTAFDNGDYQTAIEQFEDFLIENPALPDDSDSELQRGKAYLDLGLSFMFSDAPEKAQRTWQEAQEVLSRLLNKAPKQFQKEETYYHLASLAALLGKSEQAFDYLAELPEALLFRARVAPFFISFWDNPRFKALFAGLSPTNNEWENYYNYGIGAKQHGDLANSLRLHLQALAYLPASTTMRAEVWHNAGAAFLRVKQTSFAKRYLEKAQEYYEIDLATQRRSDKSEAYLHFWLAAVYALLANEDKMLLHLEQCLALDSKYAQEIIYEEDFEGYLFHKKFRRLLKPYVKDIKLEILEAILQKISRERTWERSEEELDWLEKFISIEWNEKQLSAYFADDLLRYWEFLDEVDECLYRLAVLHHQKGELEQSQAYFEMILESLSIDDDFFEEYDSFQQSRELFRKAQVLAYLSEKEALLETLEHCLSLNFNYVDILREDSEGVFEAYQEDAEFKQLLEKYEAKQAAYHYKGEALTKTDLSEEQWRQREAFVQILTQNDWQKDAYCNDEIEWASISPQANYVYYPANPSEKALRLGLHLDTQMLFFEVYEGDELGVVLFLYIKPGKSLINMQEILRLIVKHQDSWEEEDNLTKFVNSLLKVCHKIETYDDSQNRGQISKA